MTFQRFAVAERATGRIAATADLGVFGRWVNGHFPNGFTVPAGETWELGRVTSGGNVVVEGTLRAHPADHADVRSLAFVGVDESRFVGGHTHMPLASDVGLWVTGDGALDLQGAPKAAWTRVAGGIAKGATLIPVEDADGWRVGDRIAITPTAKPTRDNGQFHQDVAHAVAYDEREIIAIVGRTLTVAPLAFDHPAVSLPDGGRGAEVLNLTRNVVIEGTPGGRAHIQILHAGRQDISHVEIRHMGPRRGGGEVLGRYGLHFHMCGTQAAGSTVEGVAVHSGSGAAFVPHSSDGITFRRCVSHDIEGRGFWWDIPNRGSKLELTSDILWDQCVASKSWARQGHGYRLGGFVLPAGRPLSNRCIGCVAVGTVHGHRATMNTATVSGFNWPELSRSEWVFDGCYAHNNGGSGTLAWHNNPQVHVLENFTAARNGRYGMEHGAYENNWLYRGITCVGDRIAGIGWHAVTRRNNSTRVGDPILTLRDVRIDGEGTTRWGVDTPSHQQAAKFQFADGYSLIENVSVRDCWGAAFREGPMRNWTWLRIVGGTRGEREFWMDPGAPIETVYEVWPLRGQPFVLRPAAAGPSAGELVPEWGARRMWYDSA